jgi:putative transposase
MPRPKREDFSGAFHHVMNRGARKQPIFKLPSDCQGFLDLVGDTASRFGIEVHAYSLMPNHYHLMVRSVSGNLSEAMQHLNGNYTLWLNRRHSWDGPVFRGRFKSQLVADESHLRILLAYIHLNPLRARLVSRLTSEAWTSHRAYLGLEQPPGWLTTRLFLDLLDGTQGLNEFVHSVHQGAVRYPEDFNMESGLFRRKAIVREPGTITGPRKMQSRAQPDTRHRPVAEVIAAVCRATGSTEEELLRGEHGPAANPARRFAIWALHRGAGLKQREIAKRMKATYYQVSRLLSRLRGGKANEPLRGWMQEWLNAE